MFILILKPFLPIVCFKVGPQSLENYLKNKFIYFNNNLKHSIYSEPTCSSSAPPRIPFVTRKCRKMFSYFQKLNRQILIVIYCRIQCYNESCVRLATNCKDIKLRNGPNQNILMILSCQLGGYAEIWIASVKSPVWFSRKI